MQIHFVSGKHFTVPGTLTTAHANVSAANTEAMRLIGMMAEDLKTRIEPVALAADWRTYLAEVQKARIVEVDGEEPEHGDDLAGLSDCDVQITQIEMVDPRIVVKIKGGMVESFTSDIPIVAHVLDYDVDGVDEDDLHQIPDRVFRGKLKTLPATVQIHSGSQIVIDPVAIEAIVEAVTVTPDEATG